MSDHPHIATARRVLALEADALGALSRCLREDFVAAVETILKAKGRVICTGIGKSGHVARKIAATMASTDFVTATRKISSGARRARRHADLIRLCTSASRSLKNS